MERRDFDKALEAWGQIFKGNRINDAIVFDNELGKGSVDGFRCNDQIEILRFEFTLKQKIASHGRNMNPIQEYIPVFFGEPSKRKTLEIEIEEGNIEEFAVFTEGAFTTNTVDTITWEFLPDRQIQFLAVRLKKEYYLELANKSEYHKTLFSEESPFYIFEEFDPVMHGMFWRSYSFEKGSVYEKELIHACGMHLIATFFTKINQREKILESNKYPFNTKAVFKARQILKTQIDKQISIDELGRECGLSGSRLRALFKQVFGVTIHQFHQDVRLDAAKIYLQKGEKTMSMIAMDLGFSSASHFSSAFKKKYGVTPREFKEDIKR